MLPPLFLHITQCNDVCECPCAYCLAPHPVCCALECGTTAYCTRQMSLRCHFAAQFLLIFLTLRSEQSPPHSSLRSPSHLLSPQYSPVVAQNTHTRTHTPFYLCPIQPRGKPGTFKKIHFLTHDFLLFWLLKILYVSVL